MVQTVGVSAASVDLLCIPCIPCIVFLVFLEERAMKDLYPMRKSLVDLSEILYWV